MSTDNVKGSSYLRVLYLLRQRGYSNEDVECFRGALEVSEEVWRKMLDRQSELLKDLLTEVERLEPIILPTSRLYPILEEVEHVEKERQALVQQRQEEREMDLKKRLPRLFAGKRG